MGTTAPGVTSLDLSGWNVSNVTTMASMFNGANKLQTLDTTGWNPEKVTTMNSMFYNATALNTITGTANWQTDAVTNLGYTFVGTALTNLDLSGWNTAAVTNMGYTFNNSPLVTIDLKGWTTASITANYAMECMFQNTSALTNLDMRTADFDKATTVYPNMFRGSNIGGTTMIVKDDAVINDLTVRLNLSPRPFNIITP
ncbi:BspA family leucine-rich repeat surface protein [Lactococcus laudensis]|nr:BspA family leucine-rich repeat surface protein [Lactococcus laudensis]